MQRSPKGLTTKHKKIYKHNTGSVKKKGLGTFSVKKTESYYV